MNQLLLLRAFLGFRLLAIGDVSPDQDCASVGTTQGFDGDLEPDDAPHPMRSVFKAVMQRSAGNHLVRAVTQVGRNGSKKMSLPDAVQLFAATRGRADVAYRLRRGENSGRALFRLPALLKGSAGPKTAGQEMSQDLTSSDN